MGDNRLPLLEQIAAAARDIILANGLQTVGRDGRSRVLVTKLEAEGKLAGLLREAGVLPETEEEMLAARRELVAGFRARPEFANLSDSMARALFGEAERKKGRPR